MTQPKVYVDYWGWTSDPSGERSYLNNLVSGLGASNWLNTLTQYGDNETIQCPAQQQCWYNGTVQISNPGVLLAGTWSDPNPAPSDWSGPAVAQEAFAAQNYFGDPTGLYVIAFPTGTAQNVTGDCANHGVATDLTTGARVYFVFLPYLTDSTFGGCYQSAISQPLDSVGIVGSHEIAEGITDPNAGGGWFGPGGLYSEIGDECAEVYSDVNLPTGTFALQGLWSNDAGGCTMSSPGSLTSQVPPPAP